MVQGFIGHTELDLPVACTYDFEVAAAKYLHALDGRRPSPCCSCSAAPSSPRDPPASESSRCRGRRRRRSRLPVPAWREVMDRYFPGTRVDPPSPRHLRRPASVPRAPRPAHLGRRDRDPAQGSSGGGAVVSLEMARKVADTVLYEGYVLYPYRASATKNQVRWQFGIVAPRGYSESGGSEPWAMQTECLVEPGDAAVARGPDPVPPAPGARGRGGPRPARAAYRPVPMLAVGDRQLATWEEGVERRSTCPAMSIAEVDGRRTRRAHRDRSPGRRRGVARPWRGDPGPRGAHRAGRSRASCAWRASRSAAWSRCACGSRTLSPWDAAPDEPAAPDERTRAMRRSMAGTHTLLRLRDGAFVSLLDPPEWATAAAASCENQGTWPVLVGEEGARECPALLADHPLRLSRRWPRRAREISSTPPRSTRS